MDQTRFMTVDTGDEVIRQLDMDGRLSAEEGDTFALRLNVAISYEDEVVEQSFTLIASRIKHRMPAYEHPNGDDVYETTAQIESVGESFAVSVTLPLGRTSFEGACVTVSTEMERIILEYIARRDTV